MSMDSIAIIHQIILRGHWHLQLPVIYPFQLKLETQLRMQHFDVVNK